MSVRKRKRKFTIFVRDILHISLILFARLLFSFRFLLSLPHPCHRSFFFCESVFICLLLRIFLCLSKYFSLFSFSIFIISCSCRMLLVCFLHRRSLMLPLHTAYLFSLSRSVCVVYMSVCYQSFSLFGFSSCGILFFSCSFFSFSIVGCVCVSV